MDVEPERVDLFVRALNTTAQQAREPRSLLLPLLPLLTGQVVVFDTGGPRVNYATNEVRYPADLETGDRVRDTIASTRNGSGGLLVTLAHDIVAEQAGRTVCTARTLVPLGRSFAGSR